MSETVNETLEKALRKAGSVPEFVSYQFTRAGLTPADVAERLSCSEQTAQRLALSWMPREECWATDAVELARRCDVDPERLMELLRLPALCNFCGSRPTLACEVGLHFVGCECSASGPLASTPEKALDGWARLVGQVAPP